MKAANDKLDAARRASLSNYVAGLGEKISAESATAGAALYGVAAAIKAGPEAERRFAAELADLLRRCGTWTTVEPGGTP